jgi:hypothetical protein
MFALFSSSSDTISLLLSLAAMWSSVSPLKMQEHQLMKTKVKV